MSSVREDPTKCRKGLHDWVPENIYTDPIQHKDRCRECEKDRIKATKTGEHTPHPHGSGHCRKGHAYTPENTRKTAKIINGAKVIQRHCIRCAEDARRTVRR